MTLLLVSSSPPPMLLLCGTHGLSRSPHAPARCNWVSSSSGGILLGYNCSPQVCGFRWRGTLSCAAGLLVGTVLGRGMEGVRRSRVEVSKETLPRWPFL